MAKQGKYSHQELVDKAVAWLKRPLNRHGPACHVAVSECKTGYNGEIPDAFGYRALTEALGGTVLVECKTSLSDFKRDATKPHRNGTTLGVGQHRFYMCEAGLLSIKDLPAGWGLLEVTARGAVKCTHGYPATTHYGNRQEAFDATLFEVDRDRELNVLIRLLARIGDAELLNGIRRANSKLESEVSALREQLKTYQLADLMKQLEEIENSSTPIHRQIIRKKNQLDRHKDSTNADRE